MQRIPLRQRWPIQQKIRSILLFCKRSHTREYSGLIDHLGSDLRWLRLVGATGFLRLRGEREENSGKQNRGDACTAAGCEKTTTIQVHCGSFDKGRQLSAQL